MSSIETMGDKNKEIDGREFVSLITAHQRQLYAYILTLVPHINDANDVLQETTVTMWEKKENFESGTDFVGWGARIAYFKILEYRKKAKRNQRLIIADEQLEQIAEKAVTYSQKEGDLIYRVNECLKKLSVNDQSLIQLRYSAGLSVKDIADKVQKSMRAIYIHISRIHGLLLECVERQ